MTGRRLRGSAEVSLFAPAERPGAGAEALVSEGGDVRLWRGWLEPQAATELLGSIREAVSWTRERRKMYDRVIDVPREQAWLGDAPPATGPFTPPLARVRLELEALKGARFAYVLLNRYRNGHDSVAWHNDRETDGLSMPTIASLTLGATRAFDLRAKNDRARIVSVDLDHGDLLVMRGETQRNWEHRVAKDARIAGERINLTFRQTPAASGNPNSIN